MSECAFKSAVELANAIASREVSSLKLTDMYIRRVESVGSHHHLVMPGRESTFNNQHPFRQGSNTLA